MTSLLAIGAGGALGAMLRSIANTGITRVLGSDFPFGILIVNVLGCFMMGAVMEAAALRWQISSDVRAFLTTGFLGGFTTFSAFSLDAVLLYQRGFPWQSMFYVVASVGLSVAAFIAGAMLMKGIFRA